MKALIDWVDFAEKIAEYTGVDANTINENTSIYNDLGMDSLGLFSMGMYLIKTYGVKIPISSVARIETVKDIHVMMNEQINVDNAL